IATPESRIISPAAVPLAPSAPKRGMIVAASIPLGLLLGLLAALSVEKLAPLWPVKVDGARRAALMPAGGMMAPRGTSPYAQAQPPRPPQANVKPKPRSVPTPMPTWNGPPILAEISDSAPLKAGDYVLDYPKSAYAHR